MKAVYLSFALIFTASFYGCAGSQIQTEALRGLLAKHLIVSLPEETAFPNEMTLELPAASGVAGQSVAIGNQMLQSLGSSSLEQKIGQAVKDSGASLNRQTSQLFARELRDTGLFAGVISSGGDAQIDLRVTRWGLAWDAGSGRYLPVFDLEATLSVPPLGVVWRGHRTASDLSTAVTSQIIDLDPNLLALRPQKLIQSLNLAAEDLSKQLVEDLRGKAQAR